MKRVLLSLILLSPLTFAAPKQHVVSFGKWTSVKWFQDYVAYCGISDDGKKLFAMVAELGKRRPVLKKSIGKAPDPNAPDSVCSAPVWQRAPSRVTFTPKNEQKFTFTVRRRSLEMLPEEDEEAGDE